MSEGLIVPKTTKHAFKLETTEKTAPTDAASDSLSPTLNSVWSGLGTEWVEQNLQLGHIGRLRPLDGGPSGDLGWTAQFQGRTSGTLNTAPELSQYLQCTWGTVSVGVNGTVAASPAPTTTGCTVSGATIAAGHIAEIQVGASSYETRRILTESSGAITWFPPVSAAPATGYTVRSGVAYLLTSTQSSMKSGTGFWYLLNGKKLVLAGARGNCVITAAKGQPLLFDFNMQSIVRPAPSEAAIGYSFAPPDFAIDPLVCLGQTLYMYVTAEVDTGAATTTVPLRNTDDSASYFEATANTDKLIVYVASLSDYVTKTITNWDYATQTATVADLGGTPAAGAAAYIQRTLCVDNMVFDAGHEVTRVDCQSADDGWKTQLYTARNSRMEWNRIFESFSDQHLLQDVVFCEMKMVAGTVSGKKIAVIAPYVLHEEYDLDMGGAYGVTPLAGGAYTTAVAGNDEIFLGFL